MKSAQAYPPKALPGRPRKFPSETMARVLQVRLTGTQYRELEKKSRARGFRTVSEWVRQVLNES